MLARRYEKIVGKAAGLHGPFVLQVRMWRDVGRCFGQFLALVVSPWLYIVQRISRHDGSAAKRLKYSKLSCCDQKDHSFLLPVEKQFCSH
jgi:hypothetical protein